MISEAYLSLTQYIEDYDLFMTCHSHGWKNLSPFSWNQEDESLALSAFASGLPDQLLEESIRNYPGGGNSRRTLIPEPFNSL